MFKNFLLIIVTLFFTCSAMELEIGDASQTFFDAYDTYLPSEPAALKNTLTHTPRGNKQEPGKHRTKKCFFAFTCLNGTILNTCRTAIPITLSPETPSAVLLKKSELKI